MRRNSGRIKRTLIVSKCNWSLTFLCLFALLVPVHHSNANPPTTVLSSKRLVLPTTLPANAEFGSDCARVGDVNGDGYVDLIVGAKRPIGTAAGSVRILFLDQNADVESEMKIGNGVGGFTGILNARDEFGAAVAPLGDVDGNGVPDVVVGAPGDDDAGTDAGAAWILFLAHDGTVANFLKITELSGGFFGALDPGDDFGRAIGVIGDVDGNGAIDLVIGSPGDDDGGSNHGAVWVTLMRADGSGAVLDQRRLSDTQGGFTGDLDAEDDFGFAVDGGGDVNRDMIPDIVVGAPGDDDAGTDRGAAWVIFLDSAGTAIGTQKISDQEGGFNVTLDNFDRFGSAVGSVGDLDGNGTPEMGIGAPQDDDGGTDRGAVYVLVLNTAAGQEGTVLDVAKIDSSQVDGTVRNSDQFGSSVAGLGDLDGNGTPALGLHCSIALRMRVWERFGCCISVARRSVGLEACSMRTTHR